MIQPHHFGLKQRINQFCNTFYLLWRAVLVALVVDWNKPQSRLGHPFVTTDKLPLKAGVRSKPIVVEQLRAEGADRRMQPPGFLKKKASVWSDRLCTSQKVLQSRGFRPLQMAPFQWLLKLLWISQQNEIFRGLRNRQDIGQGHLSGFINKKYV